MTASKSSNYSLELSDFEFESIAFEVRYSSAYLHWDRAGAIWSEVASKLPGLTIVNAEPSKTVFTLHRRYLFTIELERVICIEYFPNKKLDEFISTLKEFIEITVRHLEVTDYSRIGIRLIYFKEYPDQEAASGALLSTGLIRIPDGKHFGIEGKATHPEYGMRWESKTKGATVRIKAEGRKLDFDAPLNIKELSPVHILKYGLTVDIDYFTSATIGTGQFRAEDWVNQSVHFVKLGIGSFLGGK